MLLKEFFYIPNILEYLRIILIYYGIIQKNFIFFILNYILDMLDGAIARYLNQTSYLGCFLDHFVDRLMILLQYYYYIWINKSCVNIYNFRINH